MQIAFHIGANCTDGDMLVKSLIKNAGAMRPRGIAIPPMGQYRKLIRETVQELRGATPQPETRDALLEVILGDETPKRLVLSNSAYLGLPVRVFDGGEVYGLLNMKIRALAQIFDEDDLEIFIALRNPATFIPAAWATVTNRTHEQFINGIDPRSLQWSEIIGRIRAIAPQAKLTVWCNEDTPLIWGDVLRAMIGADSAERLAGEFDVLATIMTPEGMSRFAKFIKTHDPIGPAAIQKAIAAFLDKYAIADEIEDEIDMPGWDAALVNDLTVLYEDDLAQIAKMPELTFLSP